MLPVTVDSLCRANHGFAKATRRTAARACRPLLARVLTGVLHRTRRH